MEYSFKAGYGSRFAFCRPKIIVAASVCTGVSNSPPDCCAAMGSTPFLLPVTTKSHPIGVGFCCWSRVRESNPTKILVYQCFFTLMAVFVAELILKF